MRKYKSLSVKAICLLLAVLTLCSCSAPAKVKGNYSLPKDMKITESGEIVQNSKYTLSWNEEYKSITVTEKETGTSWSTIPYDTATEKIDGYAKVNVHSPLTVWYIEAESRQLKSMGAYQGAVNKDTVSCKVIDNGISVTYYFDALSISVSVEYILEEDGFTARIPTDAIKENDNKVYTLSLLPFFAAVKNNRDSYLFVPSGSGALIYTDNESKISSAYSEAVYGDDAVTTVYADVSKNYGAKLPVFGVKDALNNKGTFAVIASGAEAAKIEAQAADGDIGFSSAYATFSFRGYDYVTITDIGGKGNKVEKYSDSTVNTKYFSVKYFLISDGTKADYNGMAELYRKYLEDTAGLKKIEQKSDFYFSILGGARVRKMFLGIPYYTTTPVTDLSEALEITKQVTEFGVGKPIIQLKGYGDYGVDVGKIAGGYGISGKFGSKKDFKQLISFAESHKLDLYMNFDVIRFSRSGGGFSTSSDAALTANMTSGTSGNYDPASNILREDYSEYGFIKRAKLSGVVDKLLKEVDKLSLKGLSLNTLSNTAYSDYSNADYTVKSGMAENTAEMFKSVKKAGYKTASSMANVYAAAVSDCILGTPECTSAYDCIDVEIPFYQMVFKGYVPIYSSELNLSANNRRSLLNALKSGQGLGFSVCAEYITDMMTSANSAFAGSVWEDISDDVLSMLKEASPFLSEIRNEAIDEYKIISENLSLTKFTNGTVIYVNIGQSAENTPLGKVDAMGFVYGKE